MDNPGWPPRLSHSSWTLNYAEVDIPTLLYPLRLVEVLLYLHSNCRFIRDRSPGRPPRLSHSSWALEFCTHTCAHTFVPPILYPHFCMHSFVPILVPTLLYLSPGHLTTRTWPTDAHRSVPMRCSGNSSPSALDRWVEHGTVILQCRWQWVEHRTVILQCRWQWVEHRTVILQCRWQWVEHGTVILQCRWQVGWAQNCHLLVSVTGGLSTELSSVSVSDRWVEHRTVIC